MGDDRTPAQRAAYEKLTAAVDAVLAADTELGAGLVTDWVIVAAIEIADDENAYQMAMVRPWPNPMPIRTLGLLQFGVARQTMAMMPDTP